MAETGTVRRLQSGRKLAAPPRAPRKLPALVLLDQDGVLVQEIGRDITSPDDVHLVPGAAEAVALLNQAGVKVAVCTNQDAVGRGEIDTAALKRIERRMRQKLAAGGASLDAVFYCTDNPDRPTRRHKPGPGMLEDALGRCKARATETPMIGDGLTDLEAAAAMGCPRHLVRTGEGAKTAAALPPHVLPVAVHDDVLAAVGPIWAQAPAQRRRGA